MLENLAETEYTVHDLIRGRWSPRAFSDRTVERDKLLILLEACRWAASSYNEQPWSLIVATKEQPSEYARLLSCLIEFNQSWAHSAPVLILSVAKLNFDRDGRENRHAFHDVGAAASNLTTQAIALDLFVHQMAGFDAEKARSQFGIPSGYEPVAVIAIGYLGDPLGLPTALQAQELTPRTRKPLTEFVFTGGWGQPSDLVID
ncbi:MAG: nitroreductase [Pseudanabaena frigida]|uniref:Nitroreductase n=1 Tax=Pseudanabaena frigida TaxID=945775 RepID=A0A2W4W335_9CYAN|nr:MAG: nitroreductase [Pseudanabaena frigida]